MKRILTIILALSLFTGLFAQQDAVPYTLADRDRMIRVEAEVQSLRKEMVSFRNETGTKIEGLRNEMNGLRNEVDAKIDGLRTEMNSLRNEMNTKFDAVNQRIDDQQTILFWGFGILFSMMLFMIGFNIWDRRTLIAPIKQRQDQILETLKEMAKKDSHIKDALKKASLW